MSARHQSSSNIAIRGNIHDTSRNRYESSKISTLQSVPVIPPPVPAKGPAGASGGGGTSYPILYPMIDLGNKETEIIVKLGDTTTHYQKLAIIEETDEVNVSFVGLIKNRAVLFTLDITIDTPSLPTINWPAELENVPDLPTAEGSRYILHIVGFKDGSEEKYYVINSSGGSGSNLWSDITIDVDKNMQDKKLTNLKDISFHVTTGSESRIDGDDYVISSYIQGSLYGTITQSQSAGYQGQGVQEVWGRPLTGYLDTSPIASYKTVSADATPSVSQVIGELAHDAFNAAAVRKTLFSQTTVWDDTTNGSEDAHTNFDVIQAGTLVTVMQLYGNVAGFRRAQFIGDVVVNGTTYLGDAVTDLIYFFARANTSLDFQSDNTFDIASSTRKLANMYAYAWRGGTGYSMQYITGTGLRGDLPSGLNYEYYVNSTLALAVNLSNLDLNSSYIQRINYLKFITAFTGLSSSDYGIGAQADTRFLFNAPSGKDIAFAFGGTRELIFNSGGMRPQSDADISIGDFTHFFVTGYFYNFDVKDFLWLENIGTNPTVDGMIRNNGGDVIIRSGGINRDMSDPLFDSIAVTGTASLTGASIFLGDSSSDALAISAATQHLASVRYPVTSQSGTYTAGVGDYMIRCTSTSNQTMNLPTAVGISGRVYIFYKTAATGTVTIDANGSQTIDGALTQTISTQYGVIRIMSDGANWMII